MTLIGTITEGGQTYPLNDDAVAGWCAIGRHDHCAHRPGGQQEHGVQMPAGGGFPAYLWRCGCACHTQSAAVGRLF